MYSCSLRLHKAIVCNNVCEIRKLLDMYPDIINKKINNNNTPLHVAVMYRNVESVITLLDYGAKTNSYNFYTPSPLYYAIIGSKNLFKKRKYFPDIDKKINDCNTIIRALVEKGAELMGLEIAISTKNLWLVKFLIEKGINITRTGFFPEDVDYNVIDIEMCKMLLELNIDINTYICGNTLLRYAIKASNLKLIRFLLENGADIEKINEKYQDPNIVEAVEKGNIEVVEYLIDSGIDVNKSSTYSGRVAIYHAILVGNYKMVELLLRRGSNPFVLYHNSTSLIKVAVKAKKNRLKIIQLLLSYNIKLCGDNNSYLKTLLIEYSEDAYNIIIILLKNGLKITSSTLLSDYISNYTSLRIFKKLICNLGNTDMSSFLHYSATSNKVWHISRFLLRHGAKVNIRNSKGITPLFEAIDNGADKNIKLLLDYESDINDIDDEGNPMLTKVLCYNKATGKIQTKHIKAARIILPYLQKLGLKYPYLKNMNPFKQNIKIFSLDILKEIKDKSDKEIDTMKKTILREVNNGSNKITITMYDVLLERKSELLVTIIKNPIVKKKCSELEQFRRLIRNTIKRIEDRRINIHDTKKAIDEYTKRSGNVWYYLPYGIKVNILCYLSNDELISVKNAIEI
ncbi:SWPV1-293 [Shearwaterpox virus]|uniref:SWPV1-293 n=1 Tax=Shearwaterpox virus TaxID=1974596 RepID=A0A1V0S896_CNPV|nr:SWPV1-293 [Shearwaterpox virus]